MDEELRRKFTLKKIEDLKTNNIHLLPVIICERDDPKITEIVRRNIFIAINYGGLVPFTSDHIKPSIKEKLDKTKGKRNWGELYIDVNIN